MTAVMERAGAVASTPPAPAAKLAWLRQRGMGATVLVAAISSALPVSAPAFSMTASSRPCSSASFSMSASGSL